MIQIFVTGGTFDKEYNFVTGKLYFKETHLKEMLELGRCSLETEIKTLMMIDSLEMTEAEREVIALNCERSSADKIIITHGTDTMVKTGLFLAKKGLDKMKTIVITGALIPYAFGTSSDGFFNLGSALAWVQALPPGVYINMNGRCHRWNEVRKNLKTGFFEFIES